MKMLASIHVSDCKVSPDTSTNMQFEPPAQASILAPQPGHQPTPAQRTPEQINDISSRIKELTATSLAPEAEEEVCDACGNPCNDLILAAGTSDAYCEACWDNL